LDFQTTSSVFFFCCLPPLLLSSNQTTKPAKSFDCTTFMDQGDDQSELLPHIHSNSKESSIRFNQIVILSSGQRAFSHRYSCKTSLADCSWGQVGHLNRPCDMREVRCMFLAA
jgi:hypothetical protein